MTSKNVAKSTFNKSQNNTPKITANVYDTSDKL